MSQCYSFYCQEFSNFLLKITRNNILNIIVFQRFDELVLSPMFSLRVKKLYTQLCIKIDKHISQTF